MSKDKEDSPEEWRVTKEVVAEAEKIMGLSFTDEEQELMLKRLNERRGNYEKLRSITLDNSVPPALYFDPRPPGMASQQSQRDLHAGDPIRTSSLPLLQAPSNLEELAFLPVTHISQLIRTRKVTSMELTKMYLERLKRYDPYLHCVVTLTEDLALAQAKKADAEMAKGCYRGPLHGIPWGGPL